MDIFRLSDSELCAWIEQNDSIHIKAITKFGDPVELTDEDVKKLIRFLQDYINQQGRGLA